MLRVLQLGQGVVALWQPAALSGTLDEPALAYSEDLPPPALRLGNVRSERRDLGRGKIVDQQVRHNGAMQVLRILAAVLDDEVAQIELPAA